MRIIHVNSGIHLSGGGPPRSVTYLTDALQRVDGMEVSLFSQRIKARPVVESENPKVDRRIFVVKSKTAQIFGCQLVNAIGRRLSGLDGGVDAIHLHGAWLPLNHYIALMCRRAKVPYFIHPRGMLEPWPMSQRRHFKSLALLFYQMRDLNFANTVFATSEMERTNLQRLGVLSRIEVSPNGTILPTHQEVSEWSHHKSGSRDKKTILFLSRIHKKKGLELLFEALASIDSRCWKLEVVGPGSPIYLETLQRTAAMHGISDSITWRGELDGKDRDIAFASADLFVLPSYSENFGLVVAEALAHSIPVITTDKTPWLELSEVGCGWTVEARVSSLRDALNKALDSKAEVLTSMGRRGFEYIQKFAWENIALELAEYYEQSLL